MAKSIRISDELYDVALHAGEAMGRSLAQQLEHWARMGAVLDAAGITFEQAANLLRPGEDTAARLRAVLGAQGEPAAQATRLAAKAAARRTQLEAEVTAGQRSATSLFLFSPQAVRRAKLKFAAESAARGAEGW